MGPIALTFDNHNSVNGIREFARRKGAAIAYVPVVAPELRLDRPAMSSVLAAGNPETPNLLAFPAQSNFSGVQHPLDLVDEAHDAGWDVLLDAAAFAPTNRLDVASVRPDFATFSFYKMMGFPTGVGCLLARRDQLAMLDRPWFAGGTVTIASVQGDGHHLHDDEARVRGRHGRLPQPSRGRDRPAAHRAHRSSTRSTSASAASRRGCSTRSRDSATTTVGAVVEVLGPTDTTARGGTVTFMMRDPRRPPDRRPSGGGIGQAR